MEASNEKNNIKKWSYNYFALESDLDKGIDLEIQEKIKNAIESADSEEFAKVQMELATIIQNRILQEAKQRMKT